MRYLLMLLAVVFVPAERHLQDPHKNDLERFHGVWVLTHADLETPQLANAMLNNQVIITGNEYKPLFRSTALPSSCGRFGSFPTPIRKGSI